MTYFNGFTEFSTLTWVLIVVVSLLIGSFLNVVICRLPKMLERAWRAECSELFSKHIEKAGIEEGVYNLCMPRSHCPQCKNTIRYWQNIPVFSYLLQGGKCVFCKCKIPIQYPLVELTFMICCIAAFYHYGITASAVAVCVYGAMLLCLCVIDWQTMMLPDEITQPLLWLGLLLNINHTFVPLKDAVIGAILGYLVLWVIFTLFKLITKKEGMGVGDFKLMAAFGAWMGYQQLPFIIFLAAVLTVFVFIFQRIKNKEASHTLPFGPELCVVGFIMLPWGSDLIRLYWQLF